MFLVATASSLLMSFELLKLERFGYQAISLSPSKDIIITWVLLAIWTFTLVLSLAIFLASQSHSEIK